MPNASAIPIVYPARPAGLVSVDGRTCPLKAAKLEARAEGGVACTSFTQKYTNPYPEPLEVLYTLPLPANGAVVGYAIHLGKRTIRGEVRKRAEARHEYQKALLEGRTASLLEQERADTFTQKLGSLAPGETAEVEVEVLQTLGFLPAEAEMPARWEYRFPTVVGVRYEGAPGRVPDAHELEVGRAEGEGTPVRLEASLVVADGPAETMRPYAPGHEVRVEDIGKRVRVSLAEEMKLDRDLVIRWTAAKQEVGVRPVEGKGLPCDAGRYLLITLTPPAVVDKGFHRDLTVLIDASGSMSGKPLSRAKSVVEQLLQSLDPGDRFEILAFANKVKRLVPGPVPAKTQEVRRALAALEDLEAGGATEMRDAIVEALQPLRPDSQRQVVLLSDGYIGFEAEVVGEVLRRLAPGARLHAVGVGAAPNRTLTHGISRAGRGVEILVGNDDDARSASRRLLEATVRPVLTEIEISGESVIASVPHRPKDVLAGQPLVVIAEISTTAGQLEIRAKEAGKPGTWVRSLEIAGQGGPNSNVDGESLITTSLPLGALFGREAIDDLELQLSIAGGNAERDEIKARIENLGLRHGIVSRMTSLVAISEEASVDPRLPRRREQLAVELPAEVSAEGVGLLPSFMPGAPEAMPCALFSMVDRLSVDAEEESLAAGPDYMAREFTLTRSPRVKRSLLDRVGIFTRRVPGSRLEIPHSRILRIEGPILSVEFEVPVDGFLLPQSNRKIHVRFDDGTEVTARVLDSQSSPPGPHREGLTVRLTLKLQERSSWEHREAQVHWQESDGGKVELNIMIQEWRLP